MIPCRTCCGASAAFTMSNINILGPLQKRDMLRSAELAKGSSTAVLCQEEVTSEEHRVDAKVGAHFIVLALSQCWSNCCVRLPILAVSLQMTWAAGNEAHTTYMWRCR